MNAQLKPVIVISTLLTAFLLIFTGCSKDYDPAKQKLVGTWTKNSFGNLRQFVFRADNTYEFSSFVVDSSAPGGSVFIYKTTGRYKVSANKLSLYDIKILTNPNVTYAPTGTPGQTNGGTTETLTITVDNTQLAVYFTCPLNADCEPSPTVYIRK